MDARFHFFSAKTNTLGRRERESLVRLEAKTSWSEFHHSLCFVCTRISDVAERHQKLVYCLMRWYCFFTRELHLAAFFLFMTYIFFGNRPRIRLLSSHGVYEEPYWTSGICWIPSKITKQFCFAKISLKPECTMLREH